MSQTLRIIAAEAVADGKTFEAVAYTGTAMNIDFAREPVVVDIASMDVSQQRIPVLYDHMPGIECVVGHTESVAIVGNQVVVSGVHSGAGPVAAEVARLAKSGYPWQMSIGANPGRTQRIPEGQTVEVNGTTFTGPLAVAKDVVLREVSFVVLGGDRNTSAIFARLTSGGQVMPTFEEWVASMGFDVGTLSDEQKAALQKEYDDKQMAADSTPPAAQAVPAAAAARVLPVRAASQSEDVRQSMRLEAARVAGVQRIAAAHPAIAEKAVIEGWDLQRTELEVLRAGRPRVNPGRSSGWFEQPRLLEAAIAQTTKLPGLKNHFSPQELEAAHAAYRSKIGLQELVLEAAEAGGYTGSRRFRLDTLGSILKAAFSTLSLPNILSNTANKFALAGYQSVEGVWRQIAKIKPVNDLKTNTSLRLATAGGFEQVGPDGQIKHGTFSEESYTNRAKTHAKMYAITREHLINDDLDMLSDVPRNLGRDAGKRLNLTFWTAFMDNSSFFTSGNANYFSGGSTNLQSSSLATAIQKFRDQTDPAGDPVGYEPRFLVVPTALEQTAKELVTADRINTGGSSTTDKVPNVNIYQGLFVPLVSAYLSKSTITGYSSTAWYLLADPMDCPVIEVAFLNGQEEPTIETADADFETLGIQMRGYFDFGVAKQDYRGGVKSKGAA